MINIQHMSCVTLQKGMELKNWGMGKLKPYLLGDDTGDDTEGKVHVTCRCRCSELW